MSAAVETNALGRTFGPRAALSGVTLSIRAGEMFALLGPNGSGKTTLFRILSTLLAPSAGTARVGGCDVVGEAMAVRHQIGVVFQSPALDPQLTVEENLRCAGSLYGLRGADLVARLRSAAQALGLSDRLADRVQILSGGLQRRVEIAKCLLPRPRVLLLDEPSTGLDPAAREGLRATLERVRRESEVTVVMTTHLLEEAERCDRVAILHRGRLVACETPAELRGRLGTDVAVVSGPEPEVLAARVRDMFGWPLSVRGERLRVEVPAGGDAAGRLVSALGAAADTVTVGRPTLEDVFLDLTGEPLRGEEEA
jgi:ABC-2 type transport system ATP-binding protein